MSLSRSQALLLQRALNKLGYSLVEDGVPGPKTISALKSFQSANGLSPDGIPGPLTVSALEAAVSGGVHVSPSQPAPTPTGGPIHGVDVYHDDDVRSWDAILAGGFVFAFIKASEGLGSDPKFAQYFAGAKKAGLLAGPYHFYSTASSQVQQAVHFSNVINDAGGLAKTDLPPVFDFEKASGNFSAQDGANALAFLQKIQSLTGRLPIIYLSESTPGALGNPSWLSNYPIWVARYRSLDQGPGINGWTFWQYSESLSVPGIGNKADANIFQGSVADLRTFISHT